jgi:hypothetical protein
MPRYGEWLAARAFEATMAPFPPGFTVSRTLEELHELLGFHINTLLLIIIPCQYILLKMGMAPTRSASSAIEALVQPRFSVA